MAITTAPMDLIEALSALLFAMKDMNCSLKITTKDSYAAIFLNGLGQLLHYAYQVSS